MTRLEHRIPPPVVGLVAAAIMWGLARLSPSFHFPLPGHVALALVLAFAGIAIDLAGVAQFWRARTTVNPLRPDAASVLVRSGIFRRTRNPMYLGFAVVLVGWAAYLANPLTLLVIPCFIAYLNRFQIAPEERALRERFGAEFLAYRDSVRRWL